MRSNIKYANILIIAIAIAYFIIGGMNYFGMIDGKVILLCSILSLAVAIVQILDVFISGLQIMEINVIKSSIKILDVWGMKNENETHSGTEKTIEAYKRDHKFIHKKYEKLIKKLSRLANIVLASAMVIFILGLSTNCIGANAKLADTLSLFSFALIFVSLTVQYYLESYISSIVIELENISDSMEEKYSE